MKCAALQLVHGAVQQQSLEKALNCRGQSKSGLQVTPWTPQGAQGKIDAQVQLRFMAGKVSRDRNFKYCFKDRLSHTGQTF